MGDLIDIGTSSLANGGKGVDGRDALSEQSVGGLFGFGSAGSAAAMVYERE